MHQTLDEYNRKRDFQKTPEPMGARHKSAGELSFVIQKHAASRLHYDFRLELDGVLKSWAVTKGPSYNPAVKRLAMRTEDHPFDYGGFEGIIPKGEYGGGTVMLWDRGTWHPQGDPHEGLEKGHIKFELKGERMHGSWALIRMKPRRENDRESWLLVKERDQVAMNGEADEFLEANNRSVHSGRAMEEIAQGAPVHPESPAAQQPDIRDAAQNIDRLMKAYPAVQLATLVDAPPEGDNWLHEIKYDGYRILIFVSGGTARIRTRNGNDWTENFPAIAAAAARLRVDDAVIDAEAVVLNEEGVSDFSALQNALGRNGDPDVVQAYCFDLPHLNGKDLTCLPLIERKERLAELFPKPESETLHYSDHVIGSGGEMIGQACAMHLEGVVSKKLTAPYETRRSKGWLKAKCTHRQEFVIGGYTPASDDKTAIGALHIGYYAGKTLMYAGKVGTGFTGKLAHDIYRMLRLDERATAPFGKVERTARRNAVWVRPRHVCEVEFTEWTGEGYLRHPSFKGLRNDKAPGDIIREEPQAREAVQADVDGSPEPVLRQPATVAAQPERREGPLILHDVEITHPGRTLFPKAGITKGELAEYYALAAPFLLADIGGHPLSLVRCPEGLGGDCFFQRAPGRGLGKEVEPVRMHYKGKDREYLMVNTERGIVSLTQMGVIEMHPWGAPANRIDYPDRVIFDLDPAEDIPFEAVKLAAEDVREKLEDLDLVSFVKMTGGKGLHVVIPLSGENDFPQVKEFAKRLAHRMVEEVPEAYIATMTKAKRGGKIFIDYFRNDYTATAIADFAVRARPGAPVAMPIRWSELKELPSASAYDIASASERLRSLDPAKDRSRHQVRQSLTGKALAALGMA